LRTILITGANGFIGKILCKRLLKEGWDVRGTMLPNENAATFVSGVRPVVIEPLGVDASWGHALAGVDTVIHLAARAHVIRETSADPLKEFRKVNTSGTEHLAREAVATDVRRLVFMSTVGVNGNHSGGMPFTEFDEPHPHNPYSISKFEAENKLRRIATEATMELVVVRAPLVYGPGNPGNFLRLLKVVHRGIPLPFASINNLLSFIYVGNLVDALKTCVAHPAAAGQTFFVSDGDDVSTPKLIRRTAVALGVPARLFSVPVWLIHLAGALTATGAMVDRLTRSLTVDSSKIRRELGWKPPITMEQGLMETAEWFKDLTHL